MPTQKLTFPESFDSFVTAEDSIRGEFEGYSVTATIKYDPDADLQECHSHEARQAWLEDACFFCGIVLCVSYKGVDLTVYGNTAAWWGVEANFPCSDNSNLTEVANQLLPEALGAAEEERARIVEQLK